LDLELILGFEIWIGWPELCGKKSGNYDEHFIKMATLKNVIGNLNQNDVSDNFQFCDLKVFGLHLKETFLIKIKFPSDQ
jgi:hypothetical protein